MTGGKARMELRALAVSALKLNLYLVTYRDARGLQRGTAHANAEAAWLVLPPAADTPTKKHHDQPYRVAGQHEKAASCRPMPYFAQP